MELIVGIIGGVFVVLSIFCISVLLRARKTLKNVDRVLKDVHHALEALTNPTLETIHHLDKLAMDITKKSESLDRLFHPLQTAKSNNFSHIAEFVVEGIRLFNTVRSQMHEKKKKIHK